MVDVKPLLIILWQVSFATVADGIANCDLFSILMFALMADVHDATLKWLIHLPHGI